MNRTLTSKQCRAARSLLAWSQPDLAQSSGVHVQTISNFEQEHSTPSRRTLEKISGTLELAGIEFIEGGVREAETVTI
jgi:transcriptional regulator with XRE-family HTH domain